MFSRIYSYLISLAAAQTSSHILKLTLFSPSLEFLSSFYVEVLKLSIITFLLILKIMDVLYLFLVYRRKDNNITSVWVAVFVFANMEFDTFFKDAKKHTRFCLFV